MSPDGDGLWRFAQSIESLFNLLVGTGTRCVFVKFRVLFYEADDALFVNGWLPAHPLRLPHAVLDVVEAWCGAIHLRNLVREAVIFFVLIDLGTQGLGLVEVLKILNRERVPSG